MDFFFVAGSAAVTGVFTYLWLKKSKTLASVEDAPHLDINSDLYKIVSETPEKSIPYAVIQGYVSASNRPIISQYVADIYGVIQTLICREHKTEWSTSTRLWYDKTRSITDHTKTVPFAITSDFGSVDVEDPLQASLLELELVYDKFEPTESSISENILSWASGEKTKGFQRIELMLPEGVCLTGIGELCLKDNRVLIKPPSAGQEYILTTSSPSAIIREFQSKIRRWKILAIIFSSVTIIFIVWGLRKWYKRRQEAVEYDRYLQRVVESRASEGTDVDDGTTEQREIEPCVVCLTRARDCVLLDCGHVCGCSTCIAAIQPPHCPICRNRIVRVVPLFHA